MSTIKTHEMKEKHITKKITKLIKEYSTEQGISDMLGITRMTLRSRLKEGGRKYRELSYLCFAFETTISELESGWLYT